MYNHAPKDYKCPLCTIAKGEDNEGDWAKQSDIFFQDDKILAMISSKFFTKNPGHVIIIPKVHYENIYELGVEEVKQIFVFARQLAIALKKVRKCDGVTLLQNNEPASNQHAFHFHLHLIPRFTNDQLEQNLTNTTLSEPAERLSYAKELSEYFKRIPES